MIVNEEENPANNYQTGMSDQSAFYSNFKEQASLKEQFSKATKDNKIIQEAY